MNNRHDIEPPLLMLAGLPLMIGLAIGYGSAISGIALPLLLPYIISDSGINASYLLVACVSVWWDSYCLRHNSAFVFL